MGLAVIDPLLPEVLKIPTCWVLRTAATRYALQKLLLGSPAMVVQYGDALVGHRFDQIFCAAPVTECEHDWFNTTLVLKLTKNGTLHLI